MRAITRRFLMFAIPCNGAITFALIFQKIRLRLSYTCAHKSSDRFLYFQITITVFCCASCFCCFLFLQELFLFSKLIECCSDSLCRQQNIILISSKICSSKNKSCDQSSHRDATTYAAKENNAQREVMNEPRCERTGLSGFPTRSHTKGAVQPQRIARGLKDMSC